MLSADVIIAALVGEILRGSKHLVQSLRDTRFHDRTACCGRECVNLGTYLTGEDGDIGAHGIKQRGGNALALLKK